MKLHLAVGFTGTQNGLAPAQGLKLFDHLWGIEPFEFHHGDCVGADEQAHYFVLSTLKTTRIEIHPPLDGRKRAYCYAPDYTLIYPAKPYLDRNRDIVNATECLLACPKGMAEELRSGTWATVRYARKLGQPIMIFWQDGKVTKENWK